VEKLRDFFLQKRVYVYIMMYKNQWSETDEVYIFYQLTKKQSCLS